MNIHRISINAERHGFTIGTLFIARKKNGKTAWVHNNCTYFLWQQLLPPSCCTCVQTKRKKTGEKSSNDEEIVFALNKLEENVLHLFVLWGCVGACVRVEVMWFCWCLASAQLRWCYVYLKTTISLTFLSFRTQVAKRIIRLSFIFSTEAESNLYKTIKRAITWCCKQFFLVFIWLKVKEIDVHLSCTQPNEL